MNIFRLVYHYCNSLGTCFGFGALEGAIIYAGIGLYAYTVTFRRKEWKK